MEETGGPWRCCQEAGVLFIHQLPPQAEASSVKAAGYLSIHRFQENIFPELQPGPHKPWRTLASPCPGSVLFLKERVESPPLWFQPGGMASPAHANVMETLGARQA